ncbi:MAG: transglycosylase SLT domain-containing protein [Pseudomonadota bacterium]
MSETAPSAFLLPQVGFQLGTPPAARTPAQRQIAAPTNGANGAQQVSVEQAIANAAQSTSVDFDYLVAQAQVESAMNPEARAATSSATGLYQFIESTWLDTMKRHGDRFGLGDVADQIRVSQGGAYVPDPGARAAILELRKDPQIASLMAAGLAEDNRSALMPILGRQPEAGELYLAHFLGAGGAGRFLSAMQSDPSQSAANLFRRPAAANRGIFYEPNGAPRSLAGVMDNLDAKMARAMARAPADPGGNPAFYAANASYNPSIYAEAAASAVPYLITAEEVFAPIGEAQLSSRLPVPVSPSAVSTPTPANTPSPRIPIADTLSLPSAPLNSFSARGPASRSMSSLLDMTSMATGARDLASPKSLERIQRAYERLQALGL